MRHAMRVSATSLCYRTSEGSTSALGRTESFRIALFGTFSPAFLYLHADVDKSETDTGNRRRQQTETDVDVKETEVDKAETDTGIDTANHHRKNGTSRILSLCFQHAGTKQTMCMHIRAHTHTHNARRCCIQALPVSVTFCMMPSRYTSLTRRFEVSVTVVPFVTHHMR